MSKTAMNGRRVLLPISKAAVRQFCTENNIRMSEFAEISGYANQCSLAHALNNGYIQAEALSNLYQFFGLPKGYFDSVHDTARETAPDACEGTPAEEYEPKHNALSVVKDWTIADALVNYYGETDYAALFIRLVKEDYERHKTEILAKQFEGMSREELIAKLVEQMSA